MPHSLSSKHVVELEENEVAIIISPESGTEIFISGNSTSDDRRRVALAVWAMSNPIIELMFKEAIGLT